MLRVGVICGLQSEANILATFAGRREAPEIRISGARPSMAVQASDELAASGVSGLVSFGVAGGVDPSLRPGDIIVGTEVLAPDGRRFSTDRQWHEYMASAIGKVAPVREGRIVGSDTVVAAAGKWKLFEDTGAACVDMESQAVAAAASAAGLPFAVLRAVADPASVDIPEWISRSVRADGGIDLAKALGAAVIRPLDWRRLCRLAIGSRKARLNLGGAVGILGPGFGLFAR